MSLIQSLKNKFTQYTGLHIYKKRPFGLDSIEDLKYYFEDLSFKTIFDVGANIGQTAIHIRNNFPTADIWSFEPVKNTFNILTKNTSGLNINCQQMALGSSMGEIMLATNEAERPSTMNSLLNNHFNSENANEHIKVLTLDSFCVSNSIEKIDLLKIDTEGFDLEVLKGASKFLTDQSIDFVEVEVGMNPENTYHVNFVEVKQFLENFDYRLYGLYEQIHEWQTNKPILRRVNALYISKAIYNNGKKHKIQL
ncbi:MAG: FkbM family methyltransferase [Gelidibacter sp.]